jgi:microcompartment protein CcmK/EutM
MVISKVVGSAVATVKDENLIGTKLLVVREADVTGQPIGKPVVAIDTVDAGVGDLVLIAAGSSARQTNVTKDRPVDAVIMAVLDSLEVDGTVTYRKS